LSIIHREIEKLKATLRTATRLLTGYHACALRVRLVFTQVPDVVYIQHENTWKYVLHEMSGSETTSAWNLEVIRDGKAGRRDARWHIVTFTLDWHLKG